jgi:hypothetical protein
VPPPFYAKVPGVTISEPGRRLLWWLAPQLRRVPGIADPARPTVARPKAPTAGKAAKERALENANTRRLAPPHPIADRYWVRI